LSDHQNSVLVEIAHEIELNSANDVYVWQVPAEKARQQEKNQSANKQGDAITYYRVVLP